VESSVCDPNSTCKVWYSLGKDDSCPFQASPDWTRGALCNPRSVAQTRGAKCSIPPVRMTVAHSRPPMARSVRMTVAHSRPPQIGSAVHYVIQGRWPKLEVQSVVRMRRVWYSLTAAHSRPPQTAKPLAQTQHRRARDVCCTGSTVRIRW
jgi:hypothetical protein